MSLSRSLCEWLRRPRIEGLVAKTDDLTALEKDVERLRTECIRLQSLYARECEVNLRLQDVLREHGIPFRS